MSRKNIEERMEFRCSTEQKEWIKKEAVRLSEEMGVFVSANDVFRLLIDRERKKQGK